LSISHKVPDSGIIQLAASKPIRFEYHKGIATLQPTEIQGTGTDVRLQGRLPVNRPKEAVFSVIGKMDLQIARILQPDLQTHGLLAFDVNARGTSNLLG